MHTPCTQHHSPSKVCWSNMSSECTSTSSPNMCSVSDELAALVMNLVLVLLEMLWACVLALGRAGMAPLLSWMSIRMDMTPKVCEVSWYAMRLWCGTTVSQLLVPCKHPIRHRIPFVLRERGATWTLKISSRYIVPSVLNPTILEANFSFSKVNDSFYWASDSQEVVKCCHSRIAHCLTIPFCPWWKFQGLCLAIAEQKVHAIRTYFSWHPNSLMLGRSGPEVQFHRYTIQTNLGVSPSGTVLMCSFCISSMVPMVSVLSVANAKLQKRISHTL